MNPSGEHLARLYNESRNGNNSAKEELYEALRKLAIALNRRVLHDRDLLDELGQRAVCTFFENDAKVGEVDNILALFTTHTFHTRSEYFREKKRKSEIALDDAPEDTASDHQPMDMTPFKGDCINTTYDSLSEYDLAMLLDDLPTSYRQAILMRYMEEKPDSTIATELGITVVNVRQRISRGLSALKTAIVKKK
ncbi:MAG: hypothetical protein CL946_09875 [Ectothiorhodospiraceae bacterium]|nr:hypothetical protein [Ectothiorhodospiraceae bacterium]